MRTRTGLRFGRNGGRCTLPLQSVRFCNVPFARRGSGRRAAAYRPLRCRLGHYFGSCQDHALETYGAVHQFRIGVASAFAHPVEVQPGGFGEFPGFTRRVLQ